MRLHSFKYLWKTILAVGISLSVFSGKSAVAQTEVLFIGNSYTSAHSLVNMIENVATSAGYSLNCVPQVVPGATLHQHAQSSATYTAIKSKPWDYVVLQPHSQETTAPLVQFNVQTFPIAQQLLDSVRAISQCARPILYQTWAREVGDTQNCASNPPVCTFFGMDSLLKIRFRMMADSLRTVLSPVAMVRNKVVELDSTIHLYRPDGSHPNTAGVYATACTFFSLITGADPTTITFNHTVDSSVASTIRQAAKLVVYDSLANWNYYESDSKAGFQFSTNNDTLFYQITSQFSDSSSIDFGDGSMSNSLSGFHVYCNTDSAQVNVYAFKCGKADTLVKTIRFENRVNSFWTFENNHGCASLMPVIDSLFADSLVLHSWIIRNSNNILIDSLHGISPNWLALTNSSFSNDSIFKITHIVRRSDGCIDSSSQYITIFASPKAIFYANTEHCGLSSTFVVDSSRGNIISYDWNLNSIGSAFSATLIDSNNNSPLLILDDLQWPLPDEQYNLSLTVTSDDGCSQDTSQSITLYSRPKAGFGLPLDSCGPYALVPLDTSKTMGTISEWYWTLTGPDGSIDTSTSSAPVFSLPRSFNGTALYSLDLQVTDSNGCIDTTTQSFIVYPTPTASFTLDPSTCTGSNINTLLLNSSLSNDSTLSLDYLWTIDSAGTLTTFTDSIPSQVLINNDTSAITYYVTLQVSNLSGCDSTVMDSIVVFPNAIARFDTTGPITSKAPLTIDTSIVKAVHTVGNGEYLWFIDSIGTVVYQETGINNLSYTIQSGNSTFILGLIVESAWNCENDSVFLEFTTNDIGGTEPISRPVIDHPVDLIDYWPPSLLSVEVRSMNGQVIWNSQGDFNALPHLKNGCYYMSLFWDNNAVTRNKFIQID